MQTKTFTALLLSLLLAALCDPTIAASRVWTDTKGRQVRAEFVRIVGADVVLKQPNGQVARVPLESLSDADREFIRALLVAEGLRLWTSIDGRQIEAQYLRVREGAVYVKLQGETTSFPFDRLSISDRKFVRAEAEKAGQADQLPAASDEENLPAARLWKNEDGQNAIGQFERILPDGRVLLAVEGLTRVVHVKELSEADHDYLREVLEPQGLAQLVPAKPKPPPEPEPEPPPPDPPVEPEPVPPTEPPVTPTPQPPFEPERTLVQPAPPTREEIQTAPRPTPSPRPTPRTAPQSTPPSIPEIDVSMSHGTALIFIRVGGIMALVGCWWMAGIAFQQGNPVFGTLCVLCCGLAALVYGFMNTDNCAAPLGMMLLGIGIQIVAQVMVFM